MRQEREFSVAVLETVDTLVVVLDREGRVVQLNRACQHVSGYTWEEVQSRSIWELPLLVPVVVVNEAVHWVRALALDLRPAMLDDLGLAPAVRWYVERYAQRTGLSAEVETAGVEAGGRLPRARLPAN